MQNNRKILSIIPARGGSKGVPRKNIRPLAGKPLLAWTIEAALLSETVHRVVVSTDDQEIANVAVKHGAEVVLRPKEIAEDWSPSEDALLHVVQTMGDPEQWEAIVFLQATSPLRDHTHVGSAVTRWRESGADSLLSVFRSHVFLWKEQDGIANPLLFDYTCRPMRQAMTNQYQENGAIYVFKPEVLLQGRNRLGGLVVLYEMPEEASLDIDTELDMVLAEYLLTKRVETNE
jgi:CMP-N,N'-diacetyllegionaminic acid synthase